MFEVIEIYVDCYDKEACLCWDEDHYVVTFRFGNDVAIEYKSYKDALDLLDKLGFNNFYIE
mgnify:CR=1 FL=1